MEIVKVLVVDDEEEICDLTRSFLRKKNYCTLGATSRKEAIEIVKKDQPQIVLLDIRLGSESGFERRGKYGPGKIFGRRRLYCQAFYRRIP